MVGTVLALVPIGLILYGVYGSVISVLWKPLTGAGFRDWYLFVHVVPANSGFAWSTAVLGLLVVTERAVAKHTSNIFTKLGLPPSDDDNRRVLAVLAYLKG